MEEIVISITKKEVETKLIASMLEILPNEDFILRKKDKKILHKTKPGFEAFGFDILNYWPYCTEVSGVGFSIRFNAVEEITVPIEVKNDIRASMEFAKTSTTMHDWHEFNIKIFNEEDLNNFIHVNINKTKEDGLSFFAKYSDMLNANVYYKNRVLNDDKNDVHIEWDWHPISKSLTLMKLCGDKDFDEMKIKYRQMMEIRYRQIEDLMHEKHWQEEKIFAAYDDLVQYLSNL
ncbi:MAG: hypothetical protein LBN18_08755 [Dysgonamonadaceae bacterium]|jgi:hypothetical protein|nr:hypothetical protein [Dysgonamonadaceae bacterium]